MNTYDKAMDFAEDLIAESQAPLTPGEALTTYFQAHPGDYRQYRREQREEVPSERDAVEKITKRARDGVANQPTTDIEGEIQKRIPGFIAKGFSAPQARVEAQRALYHERG